MLRSREKMRTRRGGTRAWGRSGSQTYARKWPCRLRRGPGLEVQLCLGSGCLWLNSLFCLLSKCSYLDLIGWLRYWLQHGRGCRDAAADNLFLTTFFQGRRFQQQHTFVDARWKCAQANRGIRRLGDASAFKIDFPGVQRTYNGCSRNNPVRQRAAVVRATVIDRQKVIAQIEDGDLIAANLYRAALA